MPIERKEQTNRRDNMDQDYRKKFIKSFIKNSFNDYSVIELGLIEYYLNLNNFKRVKDLLIKCNLNHLNPNLFK